MPGWRSGLTRKFGFYINLLFALYHQTDSDSRAAVGGDASTGATAERRFAGLLPDPRSESGAAIENWLYFAFFRMCADARFHPAAAGESTIEDSLKSSVMQRQRAMMNWPIACGHTAIIGTDSTVLGVSAVVELIRDHRLDILVNISRPADECLTILAHRLAPVQVNWLTFASCATGLETMDYRISDPYLDPAEINEQSFTEKTVRLPDTAWCYDPLLDPPQIRPAPALTNGLITFGSLNRFSKINPRVVAAWAEVLRGVPNSCLHVLADAGSHRQRLLDQMRESGVDPGRPEFIDRRSRPQYLEQYGRIDISLDPFPFCGHTTSLDSLWMGVPVVTLSGRTTVGRTACSALHNLGLAELIGQTPEEYVSIATGLASDLPRLVGLQHAAFADAGVCADGRSAICPKYRGCLPSDVADLVRDGRADRMTPEQQLESALSHHRAGRLAEAERIYREILAIEPNYVDALHLLGSAGRPDGSAGDGFGPDRTGDQT